MDEAQLSVGLVGLGAMGRGMGLCLLRAGHRLTIVPNRRRAVADELGAAGALEVAKPKALDGCSVVVLCLPSESATEEVIFGPDGIASSAGKGTLVLECSTLSPAYGRDCALRLAAAGLRFADAPVTRGPADAAIGKLDGLLGAHAGDVPLARRVLSAFCERIHELGPPGAGYAAKLVNAFLVFCNVASVSEALTTAAAAGVDLDAMLAIVDRSAAHSLVAQRVAMARGNPPETGQRPRLSIAHPAKDVRYYRDLAMSHGTLGPLAAEVVQRLTACEALATLSRREHRGETLSSGERAALQLLDAVGPAGAAEEPFVQDAAGTLNELLAGLRLYHTAAAWAQAHIPANSPANSSADSHSGSPAPAHERGPA